jgi:hypothetical protein
MKAENGDKPNDLPQVGRPIGLDPGRTEPPAGVPRYCRLGGITFFFLRCTETHDPSL